ncbi:MAG: STAS/SEC14 domain-containing protein [Bacteroidota bacterium]
MSTYATFDRTQFPVITIHFTGAKETAANFQTYLEELEHNYERQEPFTLIFDLTKAGIPKMKYQLQQAEWMKSNETLIQTYCRGVAYVIPNLLLRGVLKFIFSVQANPVPFQVCSTLPEGKDWARQQM